MTAASSQKLSADGLGAVGEDLFRMLCGQARLVPNKSDRDVTGWDFTVEFPMNRDGATASLDQRAARNVLVQLKSTARIGENRVPVKLSAVERLAKDPRPAAIIVFRLKPDGQPLEGYLLHLLGDVLARVLRRLREAEASGRADIHRITMSFDYRRIGTRFELTPDGLAGALEAMIGADPGRYVEEKQRQLLELGYEDGGLEGEALIRIKGPEHLTAMLSGLAPMRPERLALYDRRFGIRIPYRGDLAGAIAELTIDPPCIGSCTIRITGAAFSPAARFEAEMFVPLPLSGMPWLVIRHPAFFLRLSEDGLQFETMDVFSDVERPIAAWALLVRALAYLAEGTATLVIDRPGHDGAFLTLEVDQRLDGPYREQLPDMMRFLDGWLRLTDMAGIVPSEPFVFDAIWSSRPAALAVDLLLNRQTTAFFEFDNIDGVVARPSVEAIYFDTARFAGAAISYCVQVTLEAQAVGSDCYRSTRFTPLDVRPAVDDLETYGTQEARKHGLAVLIDPENITMVDLAAKT